MTTRSRPASPRLPPLDPATLDDETRTLVPDGSFNIFRTLAHHPKLLKRWLVFGNHVLAKSTLPAHERELVILRVGWRCGAEYEFGQHTRIARDSGVTDEEIVAVTREVDEHAWSEDHRTLLVAVDELHEDQCLSDASWASLSERWDTEQVLDLIFAVGQYTLVSMALNSLGVQRDEGVPGFPGT
jgi:4-carboxymuconolactone decarboxylase